MFEDFEEALGAHSAANRRYCGYSRWVHTLEEADRERANALLTTTDYSAPSLAAYFNSKGADLDSQVVQRHRNKRCCGQGRGTC